MTTVVTVRWRTPPPSSIDERLIVDDDGHAWLEVLRPRSPGDTVGTYEGAVEEAEVRELTAAGSDVALDVVVQDPGWPRWPSRPIGWRSGSSPRHWPWPSSSPAQSARYRPSRRRFG
jgi:hypothetical protein